ncbi:MAG: LuxR C-terminal-related transcriptional regulator [Veillonellales bacterium]
MLAHNTAVLYRRKSMNKIMNNIWQYPLTVVAAPMGYGKTTAVKEYLKKCKAKVVWQTLADDSVSVFWHGFSRLFQKLDTGCANSLAALGAPISSIFIEEAIEMIESVKFTNKTVIVIDDYHLLLSEDMDKFLERLIKTVQPNLHIVIISRVMFGENTTELALKGYCYVIDKKTFEFTKDEIIEYYKLCGIRLKPGEAAALYDYTEGWISAVYLCMLSFLQEGKVDWQTGLHDLIDKVIYRHCSAEVRGFLLSVCIFDSFTLSQAQAMVQKKNVGKILNWLIAKNAFVTYDPVNRTYRMHNVLTGYLRKILDRQKGETRQAIFRLAGMWYVSVKDYIHAMDCFYKAADFDKLLTVIELDKGNSINNERGKRVSRIFAECPKKVKRQHPIACLLHLRTLFLFNEKELFATQTAEIIRYIDEIQDEQRQRYLRGELELLYSFTKYNSITGMSEHHREACRLMRGTSRLFDNKSSWTGSPSVLYLFYRASGQLEQEVSEIMECAPYYYRLTDGHGSGTEYLMEAERYYYIGDFENAEIIMYKAMDTAQPRRQLTVIICALFLQIRLDFVKGNLFSIQNLLQEIRREIKQYGQYLCVHTADLCEGFIYSCLNKVKKIPSWIATGQLQESRLFFPSHGFFNIVYGKSLLLNGKYLKLLGLARSFINTANVFPNLLGQVYTHIYVAAAQYQRKHDREARAALKQALDIAAPDQLIMPFVENGEYILPILAELEKDEQYAGFVGEVRVHYAAIAKKIEAMQDELENSDKLLNLTKREREIAELVAGGLSNRKIADSLMIAEVTVKKALQTIYAKLSISSRNELTKKVIEER